MNATSAALPIAATGSARLPAYLALGLGLILFNVVLRQLPWVSNHDLHSHIETVATLVAIFAGTLAMVRYYTHRQVHILILGTGLVGTGFFDAFHAVATTEFLVQYIPSILETAIPWTWFSSRLFLAIMLVLMVYAWTSDQITAHTDSEPARQVYIAVAILLIGNAAFFTLVDLPSPYGKFGPFERPQEILPGILFLIALSRLLRRGRWRGNALSHWMVYALIIGSVLQCLYMTQSTQLYDQYFDIAHGLKLASYVCLLVGLLANTQTLFLRLNARTEQLRRHNQALDLEISQRKRAEDLSRQMGQILEHSFNEIYIFDAVSLRFLQVNHGAQKNLGYSHAELLAMTPFDIKPDFNAASFSDLLAPLRQHEVQRLTFQTRHRRKDGSIYPVEVRLELAEQAAPSVFVAIIQDISDRVEAERELAMYTQELARSNADLEQFAYVASHDLQEPLRMVSSYTQLLARRYRDQLDEDARTFIGFAVDGATRMQHLINDLLDYSRINPRQGEMQTASAEKALEWAMHNLRHMINDRQAKITACEMPLVKCDLTQLGLVFQNLLSNAIKYCPDKEPIISIGAQAEGDGWHFHVSDNGIGIDPKYFERIFVIFQRLHNRDEYGGTGIGMAMVKKIISRHGGRIWVESAPGAGTTMHFTLMDSDEAVT